MFNYYKMAMQVYTENGNGNECEDELYQIMKVKMSSEQEQMFMVSHYLYLQYGSDSSKFVVEFDTVWKNIDFSTRGNAKRILLKNFTEHIDYKISTYQLGEVTIKNLGGAGHKETILLTVDCFKNFCMLAATSKAKEIRCYYIKMENIMHEYYKSFEIKNTELYASLQISMKETFIKRHEVLIESNKNKWVVYFCRIQLYSDGSFILKIGETSDIKSRMDALRCDFETNIILLDVFICENSIKFEKSLHNSSELLKYKYNHLEHKNKKFSTEAYHIPNQKEYERLVKYANTEMRGYNSIETTKMRIEEKKVDLVASLIPLCSKYEEVMNILNKISRPYSGLELESELESESDPLITNDEKIPVYKQIENETSTLFSIPIISDVVVKEVREKVVEELSNVPIKQKRPRIKIKQLHPITGELVKIFSSYTDVQKELKISVKKLKELIESNEIYQGKYKFKLL